MIKDVLSAASTYGSLDALQLLLGVALVPVYTRVLGTQAYGQVGVLMAAGSLLAILMGFGLRGAVMRHYFDLRPDPPALTGYVTSAVVAVVGLGGILSILALGVLALVPGILDEVPLFPHGVLLVASSLAVAGNGVFLGLFRAARRIRAYKATQLGSTLGAAALTLVLMVGFGWGVLGWMLGTLVAHACVFVALAVHQVVQHGVAWSGAAVRHALAFGIPLVPHLLFAAALAANDRLALQHTVPAAALSAYVLAYQVTRPFTSVTTALNTAWQPMTYELDSSPLQRSLLGSTLVPYAAFVGWLAVIAMCLAPEVVDLLAPAGYEDAARFAGPLLVAFYFQGLYLTTSPGILRTRRSALMPVLSGAAVLFQVGLLATLVQLWGALGAAWATLGAWAFLFIIGTMVAHRLAPVHYEWVRVVKSIVLVLLALLIVQWTFTASPPENLRLPIRLLTLALFPLLLVVTGALPRSSLTDLRRSWRSE